MGKGANQLAPQKVRMAMALNGSKPRYLWWGLEPRHWLATARNSGIDPMVALRVMAEMVAATPSVIAAVSEKIPPSFPDAVREPILTGLEKAALRLSKAMAA
jgi:serine/threonine-protein kinase HipA